MTPEDFQRLALSLPDATEGSHMGSVDFRVHGRIFATLAHRKQGYGNLMLTPELQADFVGEAPDLFLPVAGGWGRRGATHVLLEGADADVVAGALQAAWKHCVAHHKAKRTSKARNSTTRANKAP